MSIQNNYLYLSSIPNLPEAGKITPQPNVHPIYQPNKNPVFNVSQGQNAYDDYIRQILSQHVKNLPSLNLPTHYPDATDKPSKTFQVKPLTLENSTQASKSNDVFNKNDSLNSTSDFIWVVHHVGEK